MNTTTKLGIGLILLFIALGVTLHFADEIDGVVVERGAN